MIYFENEIHRGLIDTEAKHLFIEVLCHDGWMKILDYKFKNLLSLSESFRDRIGYKYAVDALTSANVVKESPLWNLGHKGGDNHWNN